MAPETPNSSASEASAVTEKPVTPVAGVTVCESPPGNTTTTLSPGCNGLSRRPVMVTDRLAWWARSTSSVPLTARLKTLSAGGVVSTVIATGSDTALLKPDPSTATAVNVLGPSGSGAVGTILTKVMPGVPVGTVPVPTGTPLS